MELRPYQNDGIDGMRAALARLQSVMYQLATGGGKTAVISQIVFTAISRKYRCWFVVPRNELVRQASDHFFHWKIPHGMITAKYAESRAYLVHIVSKDTLIRRYDKIKNWPDLLIFDEAHLYIDRQIEITSHIPRKSKIIGVTATPERLDGRGLKRCPIVKFAPDVRNGLYDSIVYGPPLKELIELGFLSDMKYFSPPIFGLEDIHRKGTEYDADELAKLFKKRAVYGKAINHYRQYADKKACLAFCRSVAASEETAQQFRDAGYRFENIDGRMGYNKRKMLIDGLKNGDLQGLTSCELVTYGLDVPRIECIIMLRPTLSRTLFFQMIGRGLRPYELWLINGKKISNPHTIPEGSKLLYKKLFCTILDHVGNFSEHATGDGGSLAERFSVYWHFDGSEKRKRQKGVAAATLKLCPICFLYYEGETCPNCGAGRDVKKQPKMEEIDGKLIEITGPVPLNDRDPEEKRDFIDRINGLIDEYNTAAAEGRILPGPVGELIKIAGELGYSVMWVYHKLNGESRQAVNVPLLHEISRQKGFKPGWAYYKKKELQSHNRRAG